MRAQSCACAPRAPSRPHHLEHPVELRPRNHPTPSARHRHHRIRCRRPARPHGRGSDHRAAEHHRLTLPGGAAVAGAGGRQDPRRTTAFRQVSATTCRNGSTRALGSHRERGFFSEYPFGTDLTAQEVALARALKFLQARSGSLRARLRSIRKPCCTAHPQRATPLRSSAWASRSRVGRVSACSSACSCSRSMRRVPARPSLTRARCVHCLRLPR